MFGTRGFNLAVLLLGGVGSTQGMAATQLLAGVEQQYESNAWLLSPQERTGYKNNPTSPRFAGIQSISDWSLSPYIVLRYRPDKKTNTPRYRVLIETQRYRQNTLLDNENFYMDVRKRISKELDARFYVNYSPNVYVGETDSVAADGALTEEFVASYMAGGAITRFLGDSNRIRMSGFVARDDYTQGFNNQDATTFQLGVSGQHRLNTRMTAHGQLSYESKDTGQAHRGLGVPATNDISSDRFSLNAGVNFRLDDKTRLFAKYYYYLKSYSTQNKFDNAYFGRKDARHKIKLGLKRKLVGTWRVRASAQYMQKDSNLRPDLYDYDALSTRISVEKKFK